MFSQGDHLFEKPGSIWELYGCQENVLLNYINILKNFVRKVCLLLYDWCTVIAIPCFCRPYIYIYTRFLSND